MRRRPAAWRRVVAGALLVVALAATFAGSLVYLGFCPVAGRFLGDAEVIRAAASFAMEHHQIYRESRSEFFYPEHPLRYSDVEEFLQANPGCCEIIHESSGAAGYSFIGRLLGMRRSIVEVKYQVRYIGSQGVLKVEPARLILPVTNCGKVCVDC